MRQLATAVTILTFVSTALAAQASTTANIREGMWFGVGIGGGSIGADCANCGTDRTNGFSGNLRLGVTVAPSTLIGGEITGWQHSSGNNDQSMGFFSGVLLFYPSLDGAFFFKLGVGAMRYTADNGTDKITATAPSGSLGIGYDFRVSPNMSVTPYMNGLASTKATFRLNNSSSGFNSDITLNLFQIGVGLTWH